MNHSSGKRSKQKSHRKIFGITAAAISMSLLFAASAMARDSVFTQKGTGPLAWSTYEHQFANNTSMPEDRWKRNIDWLADNFKSYGYDTAITDGWVEGATKVNPNGYILSHNDSWTHDWKYWGDYLKGKGMKLGVYYNPLWVSPTVVGNSSYKVVGTDIPVESLVHADDRFNGGQPTSLYWLDVTKPGAEQYVKGYVNYFKNAGAKVLRVDFLSWYEDGIDKGRQVGKAHGRANYELALQWMAEACGDEMELSLVMPHLHNDGEIELKYGDWIRVNEDVGQGDWGRFSDMDRGTHFPYWSQYHNAFDGLIYWSKVAGKGKMILDADFLRIHNMSRDEERKSAVSAVVLSGAPLLIADQYDTIGGSAWVYQNTELLALNKQGFAAKPFSTDPTNPESMKWKGRLPDGSWIVGLFNRDSDAVTKSINFAADLGISGNATVRDLWTHKELGSMNSYSVNLGEHDVRVLKITPGGTAPVSKAVPGLIEAEQYDAMSGIEVENCGEGGQNVGHIDTGDFMEYKVNVKTAGTYKLESRVASINGTGKFDVLLDNNVLTTVSVPETGGWQSYATVSNTVTLPAGEHAVRIKAVSMNFNLNWIKFSEGGITPDPVLTFSNPGFESGNITGWQEWHPEGQSAKYGVDGNDVHSGNRKLWFWSNTAYQQRVHQTKTGLPNGTYAVRAWIKQNTGIPAISRMEVSGYGGEPVYVDVKHGAEYQLYTANINVTNGQLDVGFYIKGDQGDVNLQIDDVVLVRN
ncbi:MULTISPECIES: carbohydrate-binding protein [Paenibacillus]|uniref:carbohydrate-binding protein n=1 Tax=Paenibacillus TaxID=44249 RepID=UPI0022B89305|nr:carbohydrate-binding protein [Paenibacillus caseinilyticus]MCZ8518293.1 carbohydrate-binding protein [Paenibacillus caseinilyticus]